jgi:hypothetical protein
MRENYQALASVHPENAAGGAAHAQRPVPLQGFNPPRQIRKPLSGRIVVRKDMDPVQEGSFGIIDRSWPQRLRRRYARTPGSRSLAFLQFRLDPPATWRRFGFLRFAALAMPYVGMLQRLSTAEPEKKVTWEGGSETGGESSWLRSSFPQAMAVRTCIEPSSASVQATAEPPVGGAESTAPFRERLSKPNIQVRRHSREGDMGKSERFDLDGSSMHPPVHRGAVRQIVGSEDSRSKLSMFTGLARPWTASARIPRGGTRFPGGALAEATLASPPEFGGTPAPLSPGTATERAVEPGVELRYPSRSVESRETIRYEASDTRERLGTRRAPPLIEALPLDAPKPTTPFLGLSRRHTEPMSIQWEAPLATPSEPCHSESTCSAARPRIPSERPHPLPPRRLARHQADAQGIELSASLMMDGVHPMPAQASTEHLSGLDESPRQAGAGHETTSGGGREGKPQTRWIEDRHNLAGQAFAGLRPNMPLLSSILPRLRQGVTVATAQLPGDRVITGEGRGLRVPWEGSSGSIQEFDDSEAFGGFSERNPGATKEETPRQLPFALHSHRDPSKDHDDTRRTEILRPVQRHEASDKVEKAISNSSFAGWGGPNAGSSLRLSTDGRFPMAASEGGLSRQHPARPRPFPGLQWANSSRLEMPLFRAALAGSEKAEINHNAPEQWLGAGKAIGLQRRIPAQVETESRTLLTAPEQGGFGQQPRGESINLERLAGEVYAIIERRLIIERESQGL